MATQKSKMALGQVSVPSLMSVLVAGLLYEHTTTGVLAAGDIIELGPIEGTVKPVDCTLITDDLDTNAAPTITLTVGILNAAKTDIDAAATSTWIALSTAGQAGGVAQATTANCYLSGATAAGVNRTLGIKVVTGPATSAGAGKKIAVLLGAAG
jgi:hypothetical protein